MIALKGRILVTNEYGLAVTTNPNLAELSMQPIAVIPPGYYQYVPVPGYAPRFFPFSHIPFSSFFFEIS